MSTTTTTFQTRFGEVHTKPQSKPGEFTSIPVVDVSDMDSDSLQDRQRLAKEIYRVATTMGFLFNHGVSEEVIQEIHSMAHKFFALPHEVKMETFVGKNNRFRGFYPQARDVPEDAHPHLKATAGKSTEAFNIGYEIAGDPAKRPDDVEPTDPWGLHGPNQWPREELIPGFREAYLQYYGQILTFSRKLLRIFALALDLPETYFDHMCKNPGAASRLIRYSACEADQTAAEVPPHTDFGFFTILSQDAVPGLQVLNSKKEWIKVPSIPGTFVVNIGDMFAYWTNGLFKSTPHRAINTTSQQRFSIPLFFSMDYQTRVAPMEKFVSDTNPPIVEPFVYGEWTRRHTKD
ncbi:2OG-Fe(II) oxygenase family oxidoreductase, putative [Aspergillus udagawae]|uniref:2OG-Fe(II) oxygenase family oxidoreductase, putative n=1 Tax=Aspergillus udagawae TaxID=91492 RepID=A0A8H3SG62_9EURO|nr:2OG-Fe(II) oxygenase family oxidoreductase, putative [Aspergillus udagawae]